MSGEINLIKDTTFASKLDAQNTLLGQILSGMGAVVDSSFVANSTNPVQSQAIKAALDDKVDKVEGKALSTNDFDGTYKGKLDNVDSVVTTSSTNLITSGAVATAISNLGNIATVKGVVAAKANLPASGNKTGDIYFVGSDGLLDDNFEEYIWTANSKWEFVGTTQLTVDSSVTQNSTNPVQSGAVYTALEGKVDSVSGKGLSTEDYTTAEKTKLAGLSADDMDCLKNMLYPHIIVTGTANTAFTLTKGARTINGTVGSDGTAEVLVPEIGAWALTMGGTTKYYFVTAPMTYNDEAIAVSTTLADNTPETIQKVAQAGMASNFWSVGDKTSAITLNGTVGALTFSNETVYAFILGFNHNASIEGSNSIHFGLGMTSNGTKIAFVDGSYNTQISTSGFNMNTSNTNSGGWSSSQMRTNIMPAIKSALPSAWRSVIKATTKYSDNTGGGSDTASYLTSTSDEIFLLAEWEVHGARTYANSAEQNKQKQYDYFKNGNSKVCYKHNDTSSACIWWCRSVYATDSTKFCVVNISVSAANYANYSRGVFSVFRVA